MVDKTQLLKKQAENEANFNLQKRNLKLKQDQLSNKQSEANRIFEELGNRHNYVARQIGDTPTVDNSDFFRDLMQISSDFKQHLRQENEMYESEFAKQKHEYQQQQELTTQAIKNLGD